ncbi:MAG: hypothetical protein IJV22_05755 [Bacteroidales bacterium]|nr:hypothetical protein [Bacteroidales bacterium]
MKRLSLKTLCLAAMMFIAGANVHAQLEQSVFLNLALPGAQLNDKVSLAPGQYCLGIDNIGMDATAGFGLGYRTGFRFDVGFGDVTPFVSADLFWNRVKSDVRDNLSLNDGKSANYLNIPLMIGVNYGYQLTDVFRPFGEFGLGYDMFLITGEGAKSSSVLPYYKYSTKGTFAWQIGAGCYFGSHVSAGIHYYGFGKHSVSYRKNSTFLPTDNQSATVLRSAGAWTLRIGFHF